MLRKLLLSLLTVGLVFSTACFSADLKIGVVDFQKVMKTSPQVASASAKLRKQFMPDQNKLLAKQKDLKAVLAKYKRDNAVMRDSDKKTMEKEITEKQGMFVKMTQEYQQKVMGAQQKSMRKIAMQIDKVVAKIAKKDNIDLILPRNSVAYAKASLDMTKQIQDALR